MEVKADGQKFYKLAHLRTANASLSIFFFMQSKRRSKSLKTHNYYWYYYHYTLKQLFSKENLLYGLQTRPTHLLN